MKRFTTLLIINLLASSLLGIFVFWSLYNTSFEQLSKQLTTTVQSEKNIMASVAEFDQQHRVEFEGGAKAATLSQFEKAHNNFSAFGKTGEFTVAHVVGSNINFIFRQRNASMTVPEPVPLNSELAEPMRRALMGESGVIIALDYDGQRVLAAYAPVDTLGVGLVAKLHLSEIHQPFLEAAISAILVSILLFSLSSLAFIRATDPIIKELRESEKLYRDLIEGQSELVCRCSLDGTITFANEAYCAYFGKKLNNVLGLKFIDVFPQDQRNKGLSEFEGLSSTQRSKTHEYEVISTSGEKRCTLWTITLMSGDNGDLKEVICVGLDITERKKSRINLRRLYRAQSVLLEIHGVIKRETNSDTLLEKCCQTLVEKGDFVLVWIGRADNNAAKTVTPIHSCGEGKDYLDEIKVTWDKSPTGIGPVGTAIRTKKAVAFQHLDTDPNFQQFREAAIEHGYSSAIAVPIELGNKTIATLNVYSAHPEAFDDEEKKLLERLANDMSYGLAANEQKAEKETAQTAVIAGRKSLKGSLIATITALAHTIGQRDPYTAGHQDQVAELAVAIAEKMRLSGDTIEGIKLGATIHDIGKISIPAEILSKPTRLTKTEFELIKSHAENGYNIVKDISFDWPIDKIVGQHHERLDGSGYPKGLKGDEICLEARIVAVADVVDAITSHRPYRPGKSVDFALNEIVSNRGKFYDSGAVDACVSVIKDDGYFSKKK